MNEEQILEVYRLIHLNVNNSAGHCGRLAIQVRDRGILDLEDIVQSVVVHFLEKERAGKIGVIKNMQKYVFTITRNALLDMIKEHKAGTHVNIDNMVQYKEYN